ncbi:YceD family protein [Tsukamurella sp. NPDC003166]|uniref:YceD family protein n=1 Tax=Tsukamurella sp. NPDC003166 TaxID=3154444 RepID=UPI0033B29F3F
MNETSAAVRQPAGKPYVLDVRAFGRRPGTSAQVHRTIAAPERIGVDLIGIEAGEEIDLDLQVQAVSEGVLVTGTVSADTTGQCARCLGDVSGALNLFLTELYAYPDSETAKTTDDDEMYRIEDDLIDLEQAVIDAVGMELNLDPTCTPDCRGLCQVCGERLADLPADHAHEQLDPRWAKLAQFSSAAEGEADDK